ncbi:hypothetical protein NNRS527_00126 [Nitrosospira sp. NRS527]|nr:hypothetical protein NNRS527_00126 [Nitrosospira sp. NRS527]
MINIQATRASATARIMRHVWAKMWEFGAYSSY